MALHLSGSSPCDSVRLQIQTRDSITVGLGLSGSASHICTQDPPHRNLQSILRGNKSDLTLNLDTLDEIASLALPPQRVAISVFLKCGRVPLTQPYPRETDLEDHGAWCRQSAKEAGFSESGFFYENEDKRVREYFQAASALRDRQWKHPVIDKLSLTQLYSEYDEIEKQGLDLILRSVAVDETTIASILKTLHQHRTSKVVLRNAFYLHHLGVIGWTKVFDDPHVFPLGKNTPANTTIISRQNLAIALASLKQPVRFVSLYQPDTPKNSLLICPLSIGPKGHEWLVDRRVVDSSTLGHLPEVHQKIHSSLNYERHENGTKRYEGMVSILALNRDVKLEDVLEIHKNLPMPAVVIILDDHNNRMETRLNNIGPGVQVPRLERVTIADDEWGRLLGSDERRALPFLLNPSHY